MYVVIFIAMFAGYFILREYIFRIKEQKKQLAAFVAMNIIFFISISVIVYFMKRSLAFLGFFWVVIFGTMLVNNFVYKIKNKKKK